jgi:hypothetical protein
MRKKKVIMYVVQRCRIYPCAAPRGGGNFLDLGKFLKIFEPENVSKK